MSKTGTYVGLTVLFALILTIGIHATLTFDDRFDNYPSEADPSHAGWRITYSTHYQYYSQEHDTVDVDIALYYLEWQYGQLQIILGRDPLLELQITYGTETRIGYKKYYNWTDLNTQGAPFSIPNDYGDEEVPAFASWNSRKIAAVAPFYFEELVPLFVHELDTKHYFLKHGLSEMFGLPRGDRHSRSLHYFAKEIQASVGLTSLQSLVSDTFWTSHTGNFTQVRLEAGSLAYYIASNTTAFSGGFAEGARAMADMALDLDDFYNGSLQYDYDLAFTTFTGFSLVDWYTSWSNHLMINEFD